MRRFHVEVKGGRLSGIEFGDPVRPVDALFLHANGFNALTYQSILAPLGMRAHVAALDLRGHGRSTAEANPSLQSSWNIYRDDVIAAVEELAPNGTVLIGHSMGGCVSALVAGKRPDLVTGLIMVDPVLLPPATYRTFYLVPLMKEILKSQSPLAKGALRRRREFDTPDQAIETLNGRGAFATWREPFLEDYITDGLIRDTDTELWKLACAPEWEAANFTGHRHRIWNAIRKIKCPTVLIRADKNSTCSKQSAKKFLSLQPQAVLLQPAGTSHFVPMERPYVVRDAISQFLARYVEGFEAGDEGRVQRNLDASIGQKD